MAKQDQIIRVVIERASDKRSLLVTWRKGEDYYSAIAGSVGHRSYHKSGRLHTNVGKWGQKYYYIRKYSKESPREVNGTQLLQALILRNHECLHFGNRAFKAYLGKRCDALVHIKEGDVRGDSILVIVSGFTSDFQLTQSEWANLELNKSLQPIKIELLPNSDGPSMFVAVLQIDSGIEKKVIEKELKHLFKVPNISIPRPGNYACIEGGDSSYSLRGSEFGPAATPANPAPPNLPVKIEYWMRRHEIELSFKPQEGALVKVGPLTLEALPSSHLQLQPFKISVIACSWGDNEPEQESFSIRISSTEFILEHGQYRGHSDKQFSLSDQQFQISMKSVGLIKLNSGGMKVPHGSQEGEVFITYILELVELTAMLK
ncbi:hypothetical protein [Marinobacter alexandrii]|jgi:hypothetical protein|uniref:hypothetical protein n=1 Tax=Marinobacter alexandrii TaxID=2570351 RepID=UPI002ABD5CF0|nr:hypothetical protein [Marinobacter alexandrii]